jgi:hypothetical protein
MRIVDYAKRTCVWTRRTSIWRVTATLAFVIAIASTIEALGLGNAPRAAAEPAIFASPVHAGCYLAKPDRCSIHVEPFTLNLATGTRLAQFRLVASRVSSGAQTVIYDFRPDQSNPAPALGSTYTPSLVRRDFAATCSQSYTISLQGRDTGDASLFNLGVTAPFTCPTGTFRDFVPEILKR